MKINKLINAGLVVLACWFSPLSAQVPSQLFVFGDSLSDPGNYFALYQQLEVQPYQAEPRGSAFVPEFPYAVGGAHFTNGETWVEQLAAMLGDPRSGSPAARAPGTFGNYAVGRSRARHVLLEGVFNDVNLDTQVQAFLGDFGGVAPAEATYVIWIGSNDVADSLLAAMAAVAAGQQPTIPSPRLVSALVNIQTNIAVLYQAGARRFLMVTVPNLGLTPRVQQLRSVNEMAPIVAGIYSGLFNGGLGNIMHGFTLHSDFDEIRFGVLDASSLLQSVILDPARYGLEVVNQPCIYSDTRGRSFCSNPQSHLFWDAQHPTTAAHGIFAEAAFQELIELWD